MSFKLIDIIFIIIILLMGFGGLKRVFYPDSYNLGLIIGLFFAYFFSDDLSHISQGNWGEAK
ncbi:hypothetical protein EW093_17035 [Thiospirochaeta perfilievii]|uniref:Uncharacterized protein n=1 Tax=Thiospirochaeta perfilievii TaxID=252967 RepID=A0A5C1QIL1_9SPIO|nr:hypothetical protein [Thiospirochaeta perfilievii]QEN06316.1 hypothetical protein EW093_17035 [Thiospirochaeta perfilievii]